MESLNITERAVAVMDANANVSAGQVEVLCRLCRRNAVGCLHKVAAATGIVINIATSVVLASDVSFSSSLRSPVNIPP